MLQNILKANDQAAAQIRKELDAAGITALNLISAPGVGKTSLLEQVIPRLAGLRRADRRSRGRHRNDP